MKKYVFFGVFVVVFSFHSPSSASDKSNPFDLPPAAQQTLLSALDQLFQEQFDQADALLSQVHDLELDHPVVSLIGVVRDWWKMSVDILEIREQASKPFLVSADECLDLSRKKIEKGDKGGEGAFAMAVTLGLMSRYSAANRAWLAAYSRGSRAADYAKKALRKNPDLKDVYLPLGTYNYARDLIQGGLAKEGKETKMDPDATSNGITQLRDTYENGLYFKQAAGFLLAGILMDDNPPKAVELLDELKKNMPTSAFVHVVLVTALYNAGDDKRMAEECQQFFAKMEAGEYLAKYWPQAYFLKGLVSFKAKNWEEAAVNFELATQKGSPDNAYVTWSHLYHGYVLDVQGKRRKAKQEYETVLKLERRFASHDHAKDRLSKPFRETDPELKMVSL